MHKIIPAKATDINELLRMIKAFMTEEGAQPGSVAKYFSPSDLESQLRERLSQLGQHHYCIIKSGEETVGYLHYYHITADIVELESIYVLPDKRSQGIGKSAFAQLMTRLKNVDRVRFEIHSQNMASQKLFERWFPTPVSTIYEIKT